MWVLQSKEGSLSHPQMDGDPVRNSHYFLSLVEREIKALKAKGTRSREDQIWDYQLYKLHCTTMTLNQ